jgi:hypothetical protein
LSRRVAQVTTTEELAALLEDIWPAAPTKSASAEELVEVLLHGLLTSVSGEPQLMPESNSRFRNNRRATAMPAFTSRSAWLLSKTPAQAADFGQMIARQMM